MRGDHRVALALHEDLEAAHVGLVDLGAGLEGHRLRLLVGALAQAHARAGVREVTAVGLGAVEVGLEHGADGREVGPQLAQGVEREVRRRVVLHVEGHRRAGLLRHLADLAGVVEGDLVAVAGQRLTEGAELERHLDGAALGEALVAQRRRAGRRRRPGCAAPARGRSCPRRGSRSSTAGRRRRSRTRLRRRRHAPRRGRSA